MNLTGIVEWARFVLTGLVTCVRGRARPVMSRSAYGSSSMKGTSNTLMVLVDSGQEAAFPMTKLEDRERVVVIT